MSGVSTTKEMIMAVPKTRSWLFAYGFIVVFTAQVNALQYLQQYNKVDMILPVADSGYTVPLQGEVASLSPPPPDFILRSLALGRGIVEYSCENRAPNAAPIYLAQSTSLWDAAPLIPHLSGEAEFHMIIPELYEFDYTELANSSLVCIGTIRTIDGNSVIELFDHVTMNVNTQEEIQAPQRPNFNTDWTLETSQDKSWDIYRVETVAGQPPATCSGNDDTIRLEYAAEYWFYHA